MLFSKRLSRTSTDNLLAYRKESDAIPLDDTYDNEQGGESSKHDGPKVDYRYQVVLMIATIMAVSLGLVFGLLIQEYDVDDDWLAWIGLPGELYLRALKCMIVPLMSFAIIGACGNFGLIEDGKLGWYAMAWYISTTILAGALGLVWVAVYQPWLSFKNLPLPVHVNPLTSAKTLLLRLVPDNIFTAAIQMNMLGLLTFSCIFGFIISSLEKEQSKQLLFIVTSLTTALAKMVRLIIWVSPIGIVSLISYQVGKSGDFVGVLSGMGLLIAARLTALAVHAWIVLPLIFFLLTRRNPYAVLRAVSPVCIVAFGTASAVATLPTTLKYVEEKLRVPAPIARFVCTTGCSMNTDGACMAYTITTVCMARAVGVELDFSILLAVIFTSTLVSLGAAAIPSVLLTNYMIVMSSIGLPLDVVIPLLSPILCISWLEDRIMTITNVEGDVLASAVIHEFLHEDK